ncbi:MAG: hypothetical protein ACI4SG_08980 [Oligosphaeraceae bacterium]
MEFLGIDCSTPQGIQAAFRAHARMLRDDMVALDRFRHLPACEELTSRDLKGKGYDGAFLDSLDTLTCLPPPGDSLYQGEDSPFSLQYENILERMGENPEELKRESQEYYDSLPPEGKLQADALDMAHILVNTFFMLSLDWAQVSVIGNLPFCPPRVQLGFLGRLGMGCAHAKSVFDRVSSQQLDLALIEQLTILSLAQELKTVLETWIRENPQYGQALETRTDILNQILDTLKKLIKTTRRLQKGETQ